MGITRTTDAGRQEAKIGLSGGSKTTTTSSISKEAKPYLTAASSALQDAYNANSGNLANISGSLSDQFNAYGSNMGAGLTGARDYANGILSSDSASNPYLDNIVNTTNSSVADRINALFSQSGQTGSSRQIGELATRLSENESNLRYTDYNQQQQEKANAANMLLNLNNADNSNISTLAGLGSTAAELPYIGANNLAAGLGALWGGQTDTKTTQSSGGLLSGLVGLGGAALGGWAGGGFK